MLQHGPRHAPRLKPVALVPHYSTLQRSLRPLSSSLCSPSNPTFNYTQAQVSLQQATMQKAEIAVLNAAIKKVSLHSMHPESSV